LAKRLGEKWDHVILKPVRHGDRVSSMINLKLSVNAVELKLVI
jgi:hypothetical protein